VVIKIPLIRPEEVEQRLERLVCSCCPTNTCWPLAADVEHRYDGIRFSVQFKLLVRAFPLGFNKIQALLDQLLGACRT
jgi:hypothetical protein